MTRICGRMMPFGWRMLAATGVVILAGWPTAVSAQSIDETVKFISDMVNTRGFVRALNCRNPKATKPTKMTEVYTIIPTGAKLGVIELNHGRDDALTGFTQFDLHDIEAVEYRAKDTEERGVVYHAVQFSCAAGDPCVVKATFCSGAVTELESQFPEDRLLFRNASHAERVMKAFTHFLTLIRSEKNKSPF
ncbi:MAG: hypothetical protein NW701_14585 [Nitrospira sp.]